MITGANLYVNCNLQLQSICNLIENDSEISNKFRSKFLSVVTECHSVIMFKKKDELGENSEWVSCMPIVDTDTVCQQKIPYTEYAGPKKVQKKILIRVVRIITLTVGIDKYS